MRIKTGAAGSSEEDILAGVYAATLEPERWPEALRRAAAALDASSAFFFSAHSQSERDAVCHVHNHAPELQRDYFSHWHAEDVWAREAPARGVRPGQVVLGSDLVDAGALRRTAFYGDLLRWHGVERMMGSVLFDGKEPARMPFTHLCWYRPPGAADFGDLQRARLQRWVPHFQRALRIQRRLGWLQPAPGEPALVALYVASLLLDADGTIRHCNEPAQALLRQLPRACVRSGRLRSIGLGSAPTLDAALAACTPARPVRLAAWLGGETPQVVAGTLLCLLPESGGVSGSEVDGPRWLLLLELPRTSGAEVALAVAPLFQLSPAETRVLGELLRGLPPAGIAQVCGTSVATVRTQISSILAKTGTAGQSELLLLLRGMRF